MPSARCLSCGARVNLGAKPKLGQFFTCDSCRSEFELVWLDPIELDWPFDDMDEEDFDDEFDEDYKHKAYEAYEDLD